MEHRMRAHLHHEVGGHDLGGLAEAWSSWIDGLPTEDLPSETEVVLTLCHAPSRARTRLSAYWRFVIARDGLTVPVRFRALLARAIVQESFRDAVLEGTIRGIQEDHRDPGALVGRFRELSAVCEQHSLADCNSVLRSVLRAAPFPLWPEGCLYADEPMLAPGQHGYARVAVELQEVVSVPEHRERMRTAAEREPNLRSDMAGSSLRPHATRVVEELVPDADASDPNNPCTAFIRALADGSRRYDVLRQIEKRKKSASGPLRRVLLRRAGGTAGRVDLVELDSGELGLLYKPRGRYQWLEGSRDEVLASVPDRWFAVAVAAALVP